MSNNTFGSGSSSSVFTRKVLPPDVEAMEMLAHFVLNHVPVENYCFRQKVSE